MTSWSPTNAAFPLHLINVLELGFVMSVFAMRFFVFLVSVFAHARHRRREAQTRERREEKG